MSDAHAQSPPETVYPSGLTMRQADALHDFLIHGTRIFGLVALLAHILAWALTPWGK